MKFKRFSRSFFAVLLVIATLLSACAIFASCGDEPEPNQNNNQNTNPPALTDCAHTTTTTKNQRAATCAEAGYTGDEVCTACGAIVKSGTAIAILAHSYDAGEITKDPTCIEQGVKTFTCTGCLTTKTESVPVVAHQDKYHDALDGTHSHTCTTCTMSEFKEHTPTDAGRAYPATCTTDAYTEYTCSVCEGVYRVYSTTEKATGHAWGEWDTVAATCVAAGSKTRECGSCGEDEVLTVDANPEAHKYVEIGDRLLATCVKEGAVYYRCEYCKDETSKSIPVNKNAHQLSAPVVDGDWTRQECDHCDFEVSKFSATSTSAKVDASAIDTDRAFEVVTTEANVQFPKDIVSQMTADKTAQVSVDAGIADDKEGILNKAANLTAEQKQRLSDVDIYNFNVTVGDKPLNTFSSTVTVVLPYTLKEGEDPDGIVIWYVAENGNIEQYEATYQDGFVTFEAKHFSYYAIAYEETQESKCRRGIHRWMENPFVLEATCAHLGYTRNECDTCHTIELHDVQEKLEHEYGDIQNPTVTCTEGGYISKICGKCGDELQLQYVRALGHTVTSVATCTTGATCSTCKEIVVPAHGHNWSEWKTIVEASAVNSGLRRRNCPRCGEVEESKLASTGNVEKLNFNSYEDVVNYLIKDVLAFENGKITMQIAMDEGDFETADVELTINKEGESYVMLIDYSVKEDADDYDKVQILYRNGIAIALNELDDGKKDAQLIASDIFEALYRMPYEAFYQTLQNTFEYYMPSYEGVFDELSGVFAVCDALFADGVNEVLTELGTGYTAGSLAELFDSVQTVYTYLAYRLGLATTLELKAGVEVPTAKDLADAFKAFMTVSEDANGTHYTWNPTHLMNAIKSVITWLEAKENTALSDIIFALVGDTITAAYPSVTDWSTLMTELRAAFPGTMTAKDALNKVIAVVDKAQAGGMNSIYALVNAIAKIISAEEFDCEKYLQENIEGTLDELAAGMMGEEDVTMSALFDSINEMLTTMKPGEMVIGRKANGESMTFGDWLDTARATVDRIQATGTYAFTLDQSGKLAGLNVDEKIAYVTGEGNAQKTITLQSVKMELVRDNTVKVQIPAELSAVANDKVTATFDAAGNLVIKVPAGYTPEFELSCTAVPMLADVLEKDAALSAEMGMDVYVTKPAYHQSYTNYVDDIFYNLVEVNGKFYTYSGRSNGGFYSRSYTKLATLYELQQDPTILLGNMEDKKAYYYTTEDGTEVTAYFFDLFESSQHMAYQLNGKWFISKESCYDWSSGSEREWDPVQGKYVSKTYIEMYRPVTFVSFADAFSSIQVSNFENHYEQINVDGKYYVSSTAYLSLDITTWGIDTLRAPVYMDGDNICFYQEKRNEGEYKYHYELSAEIAPEDLPAHVEMLREKWWSSNEMYYADGTLVTGTVYSVRLVSEKGATPVYYAKLGDRYIKLDNLVDGTTLKGLTQTLELPDGQTMYVLGDRNMHGELASGEFDRVVYGYVKLSAALYTETACFYMGETLVEHQYRYLTNYYESTYNWLELDGYMTKTDANTYTFNAALFTMLKDMCEAGDRYYIGVRGDKYINNVSYELFAIVAMYTEPDDTVAVVKPGHDHRDYWYELFENGMGGEAAFQIISTKEGTVSIYYAAGGSVYVDEFSCENRYPADSKMKYDATMSQQYGLNVYSYSYDWRWNESLYSCVYKDGEYYGYSDKYSVYDHTFADLKDCFSNWDIFDVYYYYDLTDPAITGGETWRVYKATLCFSNTGSHFTANTLQIYLTVKNGKLMALMGAEEEGASVLRFEAMMPMTEYVNKLISSVKADPNGYTTSERNYYGTDGVKREFTYAQVIMTEVGADGKTLKEHNLFVEYLDVNGSKRYVSERIDKGLYLELYAKIDELPEYTTKNMTTKKYFNGTFQILDMTYRYTHKDYAVKLAGRYYDLDEYLNWDRITESEFKESMSSQEWFYVVYDDNGDPMYYNHGEFKYDKDKGDEYLELSEPVNAAKAMELIQNGGKSEPLSVRTKDGRQVYEVSAYVPEEWELIAEKQSDGTTFYHRDGFTNGYLKVQDGYYVYAAKVQTDEGAYCVICPYLAVASIPDYELRQAGIFDQYVTFNKTRTVITISKELVELIHRMDLEQYFSIRIYADRYGDWIELDYYELEAWLEFAASGKLEGSTRLEDN